MQDKSGNRGQRTGNRVFVRKIILFFIFLFFSFHFSFAQELNYYISDDNDGRFIQRLSWQHTDHISFFVVVIEQFSQDRRQGGYTEIKRQQTTDNFIEVSLEVGRYRYCVEVYDLFDELFHTTAWREFEIFRAYQPEVTSLSPGGFYLDEDDTWVVTVRGSYLFPNSVYYLVRGNTIIHPESFTADRSYARLTFAESMLIPGKYDVYVKNPGGLDTQYGTFTIGYRKPVDFNISIMYSPVFPVMGFLFQDNELEAPFANFMYPLSGGIRMSLMPFKRYWGYLGAELTGSFSYLDYEREYYSVSGYFIHSHLSFLYQKYFMKKRFSVNVGLGAGVSMLMDVIYEYPKGSPTDTFSGLYPSGIASVHFAYFFNRNMYASIGADFIQMFTAPADGQMPNFVRPFAGVGMQF